MKELNINQIEIILSQMKKYKSEHPKANVTFDTENNRVNITYPLPDDYFGLKGIKIIKTNLKTSRSNPNH